MIFRYGFIENECRAVRCQKYFVTQSLAEIQNSLVALTVIALEKSMGLKQLRQRSGRDSRLVPASPSRCGDAKKDRKHCAWDESRKIARCQHWHNSIPLGPARRAKAPLDFCRAAERYILSFFVF